MKKYLQIVDRHKASLGTRFVNNFIDTIILLIINFILSFISAVIYNITFIHFFYFYNNGGFLWNMFMGSVFGFVYFFFWENFTDGRTPGKYITGTKVISTDGKKPTTRQIVSRSLYRLIPFEAFTFFGTDGWHDSMTDTRVINYKNYESERQLKDEINSIGVKETA